jgi:hypothetical protein
MHCLSLFINYVKEILHFRLILLYKEAMKIMIGLRVTEEFKTLLQKHADEENRTLSNFIMNALVTYLKDHRGIDWRKENREKSK